MVWGACGESEAVMVGGCVPSEVASASSQEASLSGAYLAYFLDCKHALAFQTGAEVFWSINFLHATLKHHDTTV